MKWADDFNPLRANSTKWSITQRAGQVNQNQKRKIKHIVHCFIVNWQTKHSKPNKFLYLDDQPEINLPTARTK